MRQSLLRVFAVTFVAGAVIAGCGGHGALPEPAGIRPEAFASGSVLVMTASGRGSQTYTFITASQTHGLSLRAPSFAGKLRAVEPLASSPTATPSFTSDDDCQYGVAVCPIQGTCSGGGGFWVDKGAPDSDFVQTSVAYVPQGITIPSISPNPVQDGASNTQFYTLCVSTSVSPGPNEFSFSGKPSDGDGTSVVNVPIFVECAFQLNDCPEVELYNSDTMKVVSSPGSGADVAGQRVDVGVKWVPGTGWDQPYSVCSSGCGPNPEWFVDGDGTPSPPGYGDAILTYNLTASPGPTVQPLVGNAEINVNPLEFYWLGAQTGPQVGVVEELSGAKIDRASPFVVANYSVSTVKVDSMTSTTCYPGIYGGFLNFGQLISGQTGIDWKFTATAPQGGAGQIGVVQLADITQSFTPKAGVSPKPSPLPTTNGYELDNSTFYQLVSPTFEPVATLAPGTPTTIESNDSPGTGLTTAFASLTRHDQFQSYFVYKPSGSNSIWITLGILNWNWGGTATQQANGTFVISNPTHTPNPSGRPIVDEQPTWKSVFHNTNTPQPQSLAQVATPACTPQP